MTGQGEGTSLHRVARDNLSEKVTQRRDLKEVKDQAIQIQGKKLSNRV